MRFARRFLLGFASCSSLPSSLSERRSSYGCQYQKCSCLESHDTADSSELGVIDKNEREKSPD